MKKLDAKLLLVEDETMTREMMQEILQEYFSQVITAKNGKEGLELFNTTEVDVILTDISMPVMNGLEMITEIRKSDEDIPVIIFSAYNEADYLLSSIKLSVCDYLLKPLNHDSLKEVIKKCGKILQSKKRQHLAYFDQLTGIYNRYKILDIVKKIDSTKAPYGVLFIDLDNFKQINDTYGHKVGDSVLKEFSKTIIENIRKDDYFGRWGGEEFVIVMKETELHSLQTRAQNILSLIQEQYFEVVHHITVSIGITQAKDDESFESVLERADKALYQAKNSGKNRVIAL